MKALEINTYILFNLDFANNAILSGVFFFFLIIDLYFLIPAVIPQIFVPTAELVIPAGMVTNEANAEIEMEPATVETNISKFST